MFTTLPEKQSMEAVQKIGGSEVESKLHPQSHPFQLKMIEKRLLGWVLVVMLTGLAACQPASPTPLTTSPTSPPATITPVPMAVQINDGGITQAEFEAELARFQAAQSVLGNTLPLDIAAQRVMDDLTAQVLLEQGAKAAGFMVDDALLQTRIDNLVAQIGSLQALADWQAGHGYTDESLRQSLRRQIAAAWMRDRIIAEVPGTAEQVHIRQILLYNSVTSQAVWTELNSGADFNTLAAKYDPVTKGELGWFPRNYLPDVQIEEAAFALQPGQYSNVIETQAGYSILMVLAREPDHILSPDALLTLQTLALENWLVDARQNSTITLAP
jgi:parvulin-like peptidyl-prolyl isomerase